MDTGAVLLQKDKNGKRNPIDWASRKLTETEKINNMIEKEMLAVFWPFRNSNMGKEAEKLLYK